MREIESLRAELAGAAGGGDDHQSHQAPKAVAGGQAKSSEEADM